MRLVALYECNYINSAGYWVAFHESATHLRKEMLAENNQSEAHRYDVWSILSVHYALRVLRLRTEFYKMASDDPTTAKMLLPRIERRKNLPAADDIEEALGSFEFHLNTQLMKTAATLRISNSKDRNGTVKKGGSANGQQSHRPWGVRCGVLHKHTFATGAN